MQQSVLRVDDNFYEIGTRAIDDRNRVILGELVKGSKKVRLYKNERGEFLLMPLLEIPASEIWLFQNEEARQSVQKGLEDAALGKISKLDLADI